MSVKDTLIFPGDKSISHRAFMLAALAEGTSIIKNSATGTDVLSTIRCLRDCGINIENIDKNEYHVSGRLRLPDKDLSCGNSGTSARLLTGLLAGQGITARLTGDESLIRRPMNRIITPLVKMGARIESSDGHLPYKVNGTGLRGIKYRIPVASAQVKSCLLLAGLRAEGETELEEIAPTRDHTEIMLKELNINIDTNADKNVIKLAGSGKRLSNFSINIPGDPSSAAFFAAAGCAKDSDILLKDILINPRRLGFYRALQRMGARLEVMDMRKQFGELTGDIRIRSKPLRSIHLGADEIPGIIDELPLLAVLATQAEGKTVVNGAAELRVKESDRITAICFNLKNMGAEIEEYSDGFSVVGPTQLKGSKIRTYQDHRIAMAFTVAGLLCNEPVLLDDRECISVSFPEFFILMNGLVK
jgi:3-phosphoshikimate 1-carboxyvinyltransferase